VWLPSVAGMAGMAGMAGSSGAMALRLPAFGLLLALILLGYTVWDADRLTAPAAGHVPPPHPVPIAPAVPGAPAVAGTPAAGVPAADPATPPGASHAPALAQLLAPRMASVCRIVLGITMAYMLIAML